MMEKKKYDMQKIVKYLALIVLVSYSISAVILFASGGKFFNDRSLHTNLDETKTAAVSGIERIVVDTSSEDVNIHPATTDKVSAHLYGSITSTSKYAKPELTVTRSGNTIYIKVEHKTHVTFGFFSSDVNMDIQLPVAYANALEISATSGDINMNSFKLSDLSFDLSSGNIKLKDLSADNFSLSCTSGDVTIDGLKTKASSFKASSGNIRVTDFSGDLKSDTTSGDVSYEYEAFQNSVNVEVSSGNITLKLPQEAQFHLDASASSGQISCDFPITTSDRQKDNLLVGNVGSSSASNNVTLHSTSGDIKCQIK